MALHPIKNLPSHARSHYFGLFVTRHEGPNVNPDLESIQNNSKRQLHNLSHITAASGYFHLACDSGEIFSSMGFCSPGHMSEDSGK